MTSLLTILSEFWRSPWTLWIGRRYLSSKKNSRFLSFVTILSMLGVGIGVTALIVVLSVMDGFEAELKKRLMASDLHVLVQPTRSVEGYDRSWVPLERLPETKIAQFKNRFPEIQSFWPILATEAILRTEKKVKGIVLKGVSEDRLAKLKAQVTESATPQMMTKMDRGEAIRLPGLYLGQELAYELGVIPGDAVSLISPTETDGVGASVPRLKRFVIEGIYRSGLPEQELQVAFAAQAPVYSFVRKQGVASQWELSLSTFDDSSRVANAIRAELPDFSVQDWAQLNSHLFASLKLERFAMFVVLAFIVIVASFNIVTTLTLMVLEKKKEIAILRAMGAKESQVAAIFLGEGLMIGTIGVAGGVALGFVLCLMLRRYEFIQLPEIYYDRNLPVTFDGRYYATVAISAIVIVLVACVYPSRRAARIPPIEGIRYG